MSLLLSTLSGRSPEAAFSRYTETAAAHPSVFRNILLISSDAGCRPAGSCEIPDIIFVQEEVGGIDAADGTFQSIRDAPVSAEILGYEDHMKSVMWALGEAVDYLRLPALQDILKIVDDKIDLSLRS